jgi:hypothetical protein
VEAILLKALEKDLNHRYQSVAELQHDIESWSKGLPVSAKSESSLYLLRKIIVRNRFSASVVGLLILIILSFFYVSMNLYLTANNARLETRGIRDELNAEIGRNYEFAQHKGFASFLGAWDKGQLPLTHYFAGYFKNNKGYEREYEAVTFWIGAGPVTERIKQFKEKNEESEPCFTEFVIAEYHIRNDEIEKAKTAYQKCLENDTHLDKDRWMVMQAKSKLYEFLNEGKGNNSSQTVIE